MNAQYGNLLCGLFQTLTSSALSWNNFHANNDVIFLKTAQRTKSGIERAKKARDTVKWTPTECIKILIEMEQDATEYFKEDPLPWYMEEFYEYGRKELKNFIEDVKLLNSKDSDFTGKIYGSKY